MLFYMAKGVWQMRLNILIWSDDPEISCAGHIVIMSVIIRKGAGQPEI